MIENRPSLSQNRREFLLFIAASTVVAPATRAWAQQLVASHDAVPTAAKDFLQIMGVYAEGPIENPADLGPALKRAIAVVKRGEPAVVDVVTQVR